MSLRTWSNEIVAPSSPEAAGAAVAEMTGYFAALIRRKGAAAVGGAAGAPAGDPGGDPGADLMGALVSASAREDGLSPEELLGMAFLLLVAGHETTVNLISGGLLNLLRHPDQLAALRADTGLLDGAVEEMLRYEGPVTAAAFRFAAEPVEIGGTLIPAGDSVMLSLAAASRDPRHFPDPDRFDIRRAPRGHLAFGHGVHHCLGAPLARAEGSIALATLLRRFPDLGLAAAPDSLVWRSGTMLRGVAALPVRWSGKG
ncbi:cytochrome P450 [Streptomyces sp. NPDC060028]|uniref:cytochrome P450 n=1 Tax=Streptomyces sp. NPDC060028 TaxID=3347041 RepID=UPI0036B3585B